MLRKLYLICFVFAMNMALTSYINSTFLSNRVSIEYLSLLFSLAAACSFVFMQQSPRLITHYGVKKTTLGLVLGNILALIGLINTAHPYMIACCFILYITTNNTTVYTLDLFLEQQTKETKTGSTRGMYLTITNIGWMVSPFIANMVLIRIGQTAPYVLALIASGITGILFLFLTHEERIVHTNQNTFLKSIRELRKRPGIAKIIYVNFILQFFYAWMVIYAPLYLHQTIGLSYSTIGIIFTLMLAPFVFLTIPLGRLADRKYGEKEILLLGIAITVVATLLVAFTKSTSVVLWSVLFIATRIGASMIESMSETYFFRMIDDQDAGLISLFRAMTPLAFTVGPLLASLCLLFMGYTQLFTLLAVIIGCTILPLITLRDTR